MSFVSMINLEKWGGGEEGKKLRISLLCELYLEFLCLIGVFFFFFFFQMQNSTECGKKDRKKTLTPYEAKVPGLTEREKKPLNTFFHVTCVAISGHGAQIVHILV